MSRLQTILEFNRSFVANKEYEEFITDKFPQKKWLLSPVWIRDWSSFFPEL